MAYIFRAQWFTLVHVILLCRTVLQMKWGTEDYGVDEGRLLEQHFRWILTRCWERSNFSFTLSSYRALTEPFCLQEPVFFLFLQENNSFLPSQTMARLNYLLSRKKSSWFQLQTYHSFSWLLCVYLLKKKKKKYRRWEDWRVVLQNKF